ncbi:acetoin dehydrogenase dihydrolipoyllysine-residue acetyltransferase subunit [Ideonella sp. A 288]|uniref:acetoin dehydrogenase dihydrolipoyllysine-residue acetyltransferase subunit n=1 Tax=Ideonella sp. A 288 TaxID=1962181 RepID=UPI000B4A6CAE|nr:acetoin dehydrogenase dihydrolipoyllysine-residue acetyltransferase subunit [Ideonella sp. A 288]
MSDAAAITPIVMPKWGLSMKEGTVMDWLVEEGTDIAVGTPILDVETDKIANAVEAPDAGLLRRKVAQPGETLPVKALLGVMARPEVPEVDLDAYIAAYVVPAAASDDEDAEPAYAHVEVDGLRIRHARRGDFAPGAVPVLFIHGFGGDLDNWLFNLDAAAEHSPVIALDLPGHGQSDARVPEASIAGLAAFVLRFMDALDVERVHAVGHSMGGAIAAQMALSAPQRVASVALVNSAGLGDEINSGYTEGFAAAQSRRDLKPVLEQLFADPTLVSRQMVDDVLKYKRLDGVDAVLAQLGAALFGGGRQAELPARELESTGKPVLVVWGREDRIIPAAHAGNAPAGATVQVFDATGHMTMMERANEVNALLKTHVGS